MQGAAVSPWPVFSCLSRWHYLRVTEYQVLRSQRSIFLTETKTSWAEQYSTPPTPHHLSIFVTTLAHMPGDRGEQYGIGHLETQVKNVLGQRVCEMKNGSEIGCGSRFSGTKVRIPPEEGL